MGKNAKKAGKKQGTPGLARVVQDSPDARALVTGLDTFIKAQLPPGAVHVSQIDVNAIVRNAAAKIAPSIGMTPDSITEALQEEGMDSNTVMPPGRPLNPYFGYNRQPRAWNYQVGRNISTRPRQYRVPFETLGNLIQSYDVAQVCIRHVIDDLRSMPLLFSPMDGVTEDVTSEMDAARKYWQHPNDEMNWHEFLGAWGQDLFRYDGGSLSKERDLAGRLTGLHIVDTTTMAPLVNFMGRRPKAPAPAYMQFIQGLPWDWVNQNDFIYTRMNPLPEDVYGLSPIEAVLLTANSDLRYQWYWLQYFTEGSIPDAFMEAPPDASTPDALERWQEAWDNWMVGDQGQKVKTRWVPRDSKYTPAKNPNFDKNFPMWLMRHTVAAFGLTPQDLGWTDDVNRSTGETQTDVQFRIGSMPKTIGLEYVLNYITQVDLGLRVKVRFDTGREKEDRLQEAQAMTEYVNMGAISPDEVRASILGLTVSPDQIAPRFVMSTRLGPIPLSYIFSVGGSVDPRTGAPEPGSVVPTQFVVPGNMAPDPLATPEEQRIFAIAAHAAEFPDQALALPPELKETAQQAQQSNSDATTDGATAKTEQPEQGASSGGGDATRPRGTDTSHESGSVKKGEYDYVEMRKVLKQWRKSSKDQLRKGRKPRIFGDEVIPDEVREVVWDGLSKARTSEEVDAAFGWQRLDDPAADDALVG